MKSTRVTAGQKSTSGKKSPRNIGGRVNLGTPLVLGAWLFCFGCAGEAQPDEERVEAHWQLATPQALIVDCESSPSDLEAELWISGKGESCPMEVDMANGTTTGSCRVAPGRVRTLTLDWFVMRESPIGGGQVRVLLAQAQDELDLRDAKEAQVTWTVVEEDIDSVNCLDMRGDPANGSEMVLFEGELRPVCDLDDSCDGVLTVACSNLGEICNGADPLVLP
jgi:hypothetical protein